MLSSEAFQRLGVVFHRVFRDATEHQSRAIVIRKTARFYNFETNTGAVLAQLPAAAVPWTNIQNLARKIDADLTSGASQLPPDENEPGDQVIIRLPPNLAYTPRMLNSILQKMMEDR